MNAYQICPDLYDFASISPNGMWGAANYIYSNLAYEVNKPGVSNREEMISEMAYVDLWLMAAEELQDEGKMPEQASAVEFCEHM